MGMTSYHAGAAGEARVKAVLADWNWQVGKPDPDMGVDCFAATSVFAGKAKVTIAVQVKSIGARCNVVSLKKKTAIRLRDQDLPVFLIAVRRSQGRCFWVSLDSMLGRMSENLDSLRVDLIEKQSFDLMVSSCPEDFHLSIQASKRRSILKSTPSISQYAKEFQLQCKEIDPRFNVRLEYLSENERYLIGAADESAELKFRFIGSVPDEVQQYQDFLDWGTRARLTGQLFMEESELLRHLGFSPPKSGAMEIGANPSMSGSGILRANEGPQIPVEVESHSGRKGAELLIRMAGGCISINLRAPLPQTDPMVVDARVSVDTRTLTSLSPAGIHIIRDVGTITSAFLNASRFELRLIAHPTIVDPLLFNSPSSEAQELKEIDYCVRALEALEYIHRRLSIVPSNRSFESIPARHMNRWVVAQEILTEEPVAMTPALLRFEVGAEERDNAVGKTGDFIIQTTLDVPLFDYVLANIPIDIHLVEYNARSADSGGLEILLEPASASSEAWLRARKVRVE